MEVFPAVDVLGGRVVRLLRGEFSTATEYDEDPVRVAADWISQGAPLVHVVDLDGARTGEPEVVLVERLGDAGVRFQVGGGLRTGAAAMRALRAGADRVVVGSAALVADELEAIVAAVGPDRIVAALDVRGDDAFGSGWTGRGRRLDQVVAGVVAGGVPRALVTAIARDGALSGPDLRLLDQVGRMAPGLELIASGGVGSLDDLRALAAAGVPAVIVGRALYEGRFTLGEAIEAAT